MYKIPLKKLIKIINPFEEIIFPFNRVITKEEIQKKLHNLDIFFVEGRDSIENEISKIAYQIANTKDILIKVRLPESEEEITNTILNESDNFYNYVAAIYRNMKEVNIELEASVKSAKVFLGIKLDDKSILIDNNVKNLKKESSLNWEVNENLLIETWKNPEFIVKAINGSNMMEYLSYIPDNLWDDKIFLKQILNKNYVLERLPENLKFRKGYVEHVCENIKSLQDVQFFHEEFKKYKENKSDYPELMKMLDENIFSKEEIFLSNLGMINEVTASFFPDEIKYSDEVIKKIYNSKMEKNSSYQKTCKWDPLSIPDGWTEKKRDLSWLLSKSEEWKDNMVIDYYEYFKVYSGYSIKKYHNLVSHWINDEKKILQLFSGKEKEKFLLFYPLVLDSIRNSQEISDLLMDISPSYYEDLPLKHQTQEKMIRKVIQTDSRRKIPKSAYGTIQDIELLQSLAKYGQYKSIFFNEDVKEEIKMNIDIIKCIPENDARDLFESSGKFRKFIEKNEYLIKQYAGYRGVFKMMSKKLQNNETLILKMLTCDYVSSFNQSFFCSKDFCYKVLALKPNMISFIPLKFWQEKTFIRTLFEKIDNNELDKSIFSYREFPQNIKMVLDAFKVEDNLVHFFDKYELRLILECEVVNKDINTKKKQKI